MKRAAQEINTLRPGSQWQGKVMGKRGKCLSSSSPIPLPPPPRTNRTPCSPSIHPRLARLPQSLSRFRSSTFVFALLVCSARPPLVSFLLHHSHFSLSSSEIKHLKLFEQKLFFFVCFTFIDAGNYFRRGRCSLWKRISAKDVSVTRDSQTSSRAAPCQSGGFYPYLLTRVLL